ncbi:MAG: chemotaxis protein CheA [Planctomycetota bacterium]|nr:chemotaxis protein CheA [Planctomycetota bacterium]
MVNLVETVELLAAAAVQVDANDLSALAVMHSRLREFSQQLQSCEQPVQCATDLGNLAGSAERLVERIILRDLADADAGVCEVVMLVNELQQLVRHALDPDQTSPAEFTQPQAASTQDPAPDAPPSGEPQAAVPTQDQPGEVPITSEDAPLVIEFITEARGHIEAAEAQLLKLEEQPDDREAISAIFRSFHTIKGVAGFLNLKQIGALAHVAENLLDLARRGELQLTGDATDLVLEAIDQTKLLIADLEQALQQQRPMASQPGLPPLLERLRAYVSSDHSQRTPDHPQQSSDTPATPTPDLPAAPSPAAAGTTRSEARPAAASATTAEATVKVATDRLDSLINMVGELVIAELMVRQDVAGVMLNDQRMTRDVSQLGKITRSLQELSMAMRMVPVQGVFQKMARLVRDLARKAMKHVEFSTTGAETELDRNVVEAIGDPLVHMVRNAIDHGIESPDDRQKLGKDPTGHIHIKAWHQSGNVVIQVRDDGRGLNTAKILQKATDAGLVKPGQELTEQEIFQLVFHPGLSTADQITDISGRGVGMDVVKQNIEALRGRIDIQSVPGQGSAFTICLPLTLAVIDALVLKVGTQRYLLPITSVEQSLRPTANQISTVQDRGEMCLVRGSLLPLFRLHRLFSVNGATEDPTRSLIVIVQSNQRRCGLLIDELLGQQQVVIKSLGEMIGKVGGVSGGAILGDGSVSMILDVPGLIDLALKDSPATV